MVKFWTWYASRESCLRLYQILEFLFIVSNVKAICFSILREKQCNINMRQCIKYIIVSSYFIPRDFSETRISGALSSPYRGLFRFAHKDLGSFCISFNKKQRCDWPLKRWTQFIKKSKKWKIWLFDLLVVFAFNLSHLCSF